MRYDLKFVSLGALVLLLGFGAGYFLQAPDIEYQNPDHTLAVDADCLLNETACSRTVPGEGVIRFAIGPKPILGATPLNFQLDVEDMEIKAAVIDLSGLDMNMGSYRFELESDEPGVYRVEGTLPVCVRSQMLWQADLWLQTRKQGLIKVPYLFIAYKS